MLANGKCNVMKEHFKKSNHAIQIYYTQKDFISTLHKLDTSDVLRKEMGEKGEKYVKENYDWTIIINRLITQIEKISKQNS